MALSASSNASRLWGKSMTRRRFVASCSCPSQAYNSRPLVTEGKQNCWGRLVASEATTQMRFAPVTCPRLTRQNSPRGTKPAVGLFVDESDT